MISDIIEFTGENIDDESRVKDLTNPDVSMSTV